MMKQIIKRLMLWRLKSQGLKLGHSFRLIGWPRFGSEPYLISIGNHVTICSNVSFITHDGATWVLRERQEFKNVIKYGRITIKDNCFISPEAVIMPGVTIGPNSVVAIGALVTRDVPPGEIWGGMPAKRISFVEDYALRVTAQNPSYNIGAYKKNKKAELLRLFPYPW